MADTGDRDRAPEARRRPFRAPKIVDDSVDAEPSRAPNAKAANALLADPSPEMIAAAEEAEMSGQQLTVAKNRLEQNKVRRDEAELEDFFVERQKRLQEQEAEEHRRYEEQLEAESRTLQKEAAADRRQKFYSKWLEYALQQKPYAAPDEVELDIHAEVLAALAKVDTNEREFVVRRLVDASLERGLKTWKADEAKRNAIGHAIEQLPWHMKHDESWKAQAAKIAREALKDAGVSVSKEELASMARAALQTLTREFEHAGKIEEAVNGVRVDGANYDELREGRELVREVLSDLPNTARDRQIAEAQEKALAPLSARVAERIAREKAERRREEVQRQREQILSTVCWNLPRETSDEDERTAIAEIKEALSELPADASERDMEGPRRGRGAVPESIQGKGQTHREAGGANQKQGGARPVWAHFDSSVRGKNDSAIRLRSRRDRLVHRCSGTKRSAENAGGRIGRLGD